MISLNRSRKVGSSYFPWSPLKWYQLFPHTMLILWTQEVMIGALLICHYFSRSFQSSLNTSTYLAAYAIRQNYLLLFLLQPFPDLSVIQLIKAFKLLAHGHYSCQLFLPLFLSTFLVTSTTMQMVHSTTCPPRNLTSLPEMMSSMTPLCPLTLIVQL